MGKFVGLFVGETFWDFSHGGSAVGTAQGAHDILHPPHRIRLEICIPGIGGWRLVSSVAGIGSHAIEAIDKLVAAAWFDFGHGARCLWFLWMLAGERPRIDVTLAGGLVIKVAAVCATRDHLRWCRR